MKLFSYTNCVDQKKLKEQWIIRDHTGRISGPYNRESIHGMIARGYILGDEDISLHPSGDWAAIASIGEFYDLIIEVISKDKNGEQSTIKEKMEAKTVLVSRNLLNTNQTSGTSGEKTLVATHSASADFTQTKAVKNISSTVESNSATMSPKESVNSDSIKQNIPKNTEHKIETISVNQKYSFPKNVNSKFKFNPIIWTLIGLSFLGSLYWGDFFEFHNVNPLTEEKVRLRAPGNQPGFLTPEESKNYLMKVKAYFERDNVSDWIEAQNILIKISEAEVSNTEVRELLCLVYKELWPFAYQDAEDLQTLSMVAQTTRALNPTIRHGKTCDLVRTWLTGKFQEAKSQLEVLIQEYPNISFYIWLKTDMLIAESDFINGQGFASSLIAIWPEFIRGQILAVQASIGSRRYQEAREKLVKILERNPEHKIAKILLGEIEYRNFQQDEKAWDLLLTAVKSSELVPRQFSVMAYTSLAQISEKRGNLSSARKYAELGFALNPTSEILRSMVSKFGGNDQKYNESARTLELVALGDQFVRSGDCLAAQAQYRAAFDLNPKHPVAGVKAAKCLYKINQIFQSFEYLKKVIKFNPEYFPAYTLLADYYSQKFDFSSAISALNQARVYSTESYEIYKGYAMVELRKNNFTGSLSYISKAISIYSTDPDAYVIMTKAYIGNGQAKEAMQSAQKSIEIDPLNTEAQIAFGLALGLFQGEKAGLSYLLRLSTENKYVIEYKLALADAYKEQNHFNEALQNYEEVVAIEPRNKRAEIGMGESLSGIGKAEAALSAFLLAATFDPTDPEPVMKAGLLYLDLGRLDPAKQQFQRALLINKNYPKAYYYIGKASLLKGDLQTALDSAIAERQANPNLVDSYLLAAEVYMVTRKYALCISSYRKAIELRPQGADNYVKLSRCYRLSGSNDIAQSMLDIAAEKESGYAEIYKERGALYQVQGDSNGAYKAYEKYLALSPNATDKSEIESLMSQLSSR